MSYIGKTLLTYCDPDMHINLERLGNLLHWGWTNRMRAKAMAIYLGLTIEE